MRWRDEYVALLGVSCGFAAVVLWAEGVSLTGVLPVVAVGALLLLVAAVGALRAPRVLVVGERRGQPLHALRTEIDEAGYGMRFCPGPARRPCPAEHGGRCPFADPGRRPVGAVVFRPAEWVRPAPPCGTALHAPAVVVQEASPAEPTFRGSEATVGWAQGPVAATRALETLLSLRASAAGRWMH